MVSALNWRSDFTQFISTARPVRWKILQITPVAGQNDAAIKLLEIGRSKFDAFVDRHSSLIQSGTIVVPEPVETIRGSYAMISPDGRFFDSSAGRHHYSNRILDTGLLSAFNEVMFDEAKYSGRDGNYDPLTGRTQSMNHQLAA